MSLDLFKGDLLTSCFGVFHKQKLYQLPYFFIIYVFWKLQLRLFDECIKRIRISVDTFAKRKFATDKFIKQDA